MGDRARLGDILIEAGEIDGAQLEQALSEQGRTGSRLGMTLVQMGVLSEEVLVHTLSKQLSLPMASLRGKRVGGELLELVPLDLADKCRCFPLFLKPLGDDTALFLGMEDPSDTDAIREVAASTGMKVRPVLVAPSDLEDALGRHYDWAANATPEPLGLVHEGPAPDPEEELPPLPPATDSLDAFLAGEGSVQAETGEREEGEPEATEGGAEATPADAELRFDALDFDEQPEPRADGNGLAAAAEPLPETDPAGGLDGLEALDEALPEADPGGLDALDEALPEADPGELEALDEETAEDSLDAALSEAAPLAEEVDLLGAEEPAGRGDAHDLSDPGPLLGGDLGDPISAPDPLEAAPGLPPLDEPADPAGDSLLGFGEELIDLGRELEPEPAAELSEPATATAGAEEVGPELILRALTRLLVEKGIISREELVEQIRASGE